LEAHIIVRGLVQGVGYRFFAEAVAKRLNIKGWVRNKADGSVEIVAQGSPNQLEQFITELKQGPPAAVVEEVQVNYKPAITTYSDFKVVR
jgi:acylphosphatase